MFIKSQCIVCEGFHCKCIDPWLTEKRNTCPLCKDVVGRRHGNTAAAADETQPLLDAQDESENTPVNSAGNMFSFQRFCAVETFYCWFLADRTNGRAIATLLRLSSSSVCL